MLTDVKTQELPGRMQIQDIHQISSDIVEFIVYVYPNDVKMTENPAVRQILLGNEKAKK